MDNSVTVAGNLVADPELRYTASNSPVASLRLAVNRRWRTKNDEWEEQTSFFDVTVWGDQADNVKDSLRKGDRVMVSGRIEQQTWETDTGDKRSTVKIIADEVGPSLRWARAHIEKVAGKASSPASGAAAPGTEPF